MVKFDIGQDRQYGLERETTEWGGRSMAQIRQARKARNPNAESAYRMRLVQFHEGLQDVLDGRQHPAVWLHTMNESMGTEDFPELLGDAIDRQLLMGYAEAPSIVPMIAKMSQLRDFRQAKRFAIDGGEGNLGDAILPGAPYPEAKLAETKYTIQLAKYGRRLPFFWELLVNDDLGAFNDVVRRFGRAARRSEQKAVTTAYANNTNFFKTANKNLVTTAFGAATNNPVLGIAGLQSAFTVLAKQLDADGEPILVEGVTLVVPPALEVTAMNILNSLTIDTAAVGGDSNQVLRVTNWIRNRIKLAVDAYLPIVDGSHGSTGWYLFADPMSGRPAMEFATRRGTSGPEIFLKASNAIRIGGGGMTDPLDGDFDHDTIDYKVRHCYGVAMYDGKMAVYSNGSGS